MSVRKRMASYGVPAAIVVAVGLVVGIPGTLVGDPNCWNNTCFEFTCWKKELQCWQPGQNTCILGPSYWTSGAHGGTVLGGEVKTSGQKMNFCEKECSDDYSEAHECKTADGDPLPKQFHLCLCTS